MGKFGFKNLFGKSKDFFDKEATIKEYFAIVPPENRKKCETYDELYEEALKYVSKQNFDENTADQEDYFHELSFDEGAIAVLFGMIAFFVAFEIDANGKAIEGAIDKVLSPDYDKNNPFDSRQGRRHRIFGHDPLTFGLKNIKGDTLIKIDDKLVKIGDYLGVGADKNVRMWDLIWKFYGENKPPVKGVISCLSHTIVHFAKDLFTPDGLPLPFTSLLEKYSLKEVVIDGKKDYGLWADCKDSILKKTQDLGLELKASDFASLLVIEAMIGIYIKVKKKNLGAKISDLRKDMKLLSMGTCLALQMGTILSFGQLKSVGSANVPGGKVNSLMVSAFMIITIQEMKDIIHARKSIKKDYNSDYMRGYYNGER